MLGGGALNGLNISIVNEANIASEKCEASILITDHSSMCFEFMIQNKPVIFYDLQDSDDCIAWGWTCDAVNPLRGKEEMLFNITATEEGVVHTLKKKHFSGI